MVRAGWGAWRRCGYNSGQHREPSRCRLRACGDRHGCDCRRDAGRCRPGSRRRDTFVVEAGVRGSATTIRRPDRDRAGLVSVRIAVRGGRRGRERLDLDRSGGGRGQLAASAATAHRRSAASGVVSERHPLRRGRPARLGAHDDPSHGRGPCVACGAAQSQRGRTEQHLVPVSEAVRHPLRWRPGRHLHASDRRRRRVEGCADPSRAGADGCVVSVAVVVCGGHQRRQRRGVEQPDRRRTKLEGEPGDKVPDGHLRPSLRKAMRHVHRRLVPVDDGMRRCRRSRGDRELDRSDRRVARVASGRVASFPQRDPATPGPAARNLVSDSVTVRRCAQGRARSRG